jgi:CheY-like chemotaxis protein
MDDETRSQIFEPFFSTKGRVEGTGLGLANVAEIMRELRGVVGVESELGLGSMFLVLIPKADEFASEVASDEEFLAPSGGSEAVLVVEEERVVRNLLRRTLESQGYLVLEAADDQAAVDVAKSYSGPISVVITDLSLPHLHGLSLVQLLQRQRPELRALFTSCHSESEVRSQAALDTSVEVVEKPPNPLSLSSGVRRAIDGQAGVESANARMRSVSRPGRQTPMHPRTRSNANHRVP